MNIMNKKQIKVLVLKRFTHMIPSDDILHFAH